MRHQQEEAGLPACLDTCRSARSVLREPGAQPAEAAAIIGRDPVLAAQVLGAATEETGSDVLSLEAAARQLGPEKLVALVLRIELETKGMVGDETVAQTMERIRERSRCLAEVSRTFAQHLAGEPGEECFAAGLLFFVGELLAVRDAGAPFCQLFETVPERAAVRSRTASELNLDLTALERRYFEDQRVPAPLVAGTPDFSGTSPDRASLIRSICEAANQLIEQMQGTSMQAWQHGSVPSGLLIRHLVPSEERQREFLSLIYRHLHPGEDRREMLAQIDAVPPPQEPPAEIRVSPVPPPGKAADFSEDGSTVQFEVEADTPVVIVGPDALSGVEPVEPPPITAIEQRSIEEALTQIDQMLRAAVDAPGLLVEILDHLTRHVFRRSALIVVSDQQRTALVLTTRGGDSEEKGSFEIRDPLSPLARRSLAIESFAVKQKQCSPFGSKAYALAPLDVKHDNPVVLYADCGQDVVLSMEARLLFRHVVRRINRRLQDLPGGLPDNLVE